MTERIDHADEAIQGIMVASQRVSEEFRTVTGEHKADILAEAQVHATLALVEQQRIANLIALTKFAFEQYGNYAPTGANLPALFLPPETEQGNVRLNPDIAAALGIKQEGETK